MSFIYWLDCQGIISSHLFCLQKVQCILNLLVDSKVNDVVSGLFCLPWWNTVRYAPCMSPATTRPFPASRCSWGWGVGAAPGNTSASPGAHSGLEHVRNPLHHSPCHCRALSTARWSFLGRACGDFICHSSSVCKMFVCPSAWRLSNIGFVLFIGSAPVHCG